MFNQDLTVQDDGVASPAPPATPATATPGTSMPFGASTPAMTPAVEPGTGGVGAGVGIGDNGSGEGGGEEFFNDKMEEGNGEENEEDIMQRLSMQNLFRPGNVSANITASLGNRIVDWARTPSSVSFTPTAPLQTPATPLEPNTVSLDSTAASSTVGTAGPYGEPVSPVSSSAFIPQSTDIQHQIAVWRNKLNASTPIIHNVVATANLMVPLDLKKIALTARNAEYNPRRFSAVIMRIRDPKSTALVFKSGKLVVTGTKSAADARQAARKFGKIIMKVGYPEARFKEFKVENLVSTFTVPFPIHLEQLYKDLPPNQQSNYEPEVFPGLIYKSPTGTLLIFVSGKCVMIGMRRQEDIDKAFLHILPLLNKHRKK